MSISGKYLTATVGGTAIDGTHSWEADHQVDDLDATVGNDGGFTDTDAGCESLSVRVQFYFDLTTGAAAGLRPGTELTNVNLYRVASSDLAYTIPTAIVVGRTFSAQVRGRLEVTATIKNKGTFTYTD